MHGVDAEELRYAILWGFTASVLTWLVLQWTFPREKPRSS